MYINRKMDWVYYYVFSQEGDSPLHYAAYFGFLQVVKLLIQNGASSTQCNNVSVIVKQVIHVPLCAHVQARCMVILVCLCISLTDWLTTWTLSKPANGFKTGQTVHFKTSTYVDASQLTWSFKQAYRAGCLACFVALRLLEQRPW